MVHQPLRIVTQTLRCSKDHARPGVRRIVAPGANGAMRASAGERRFLRLRLAGLAFLAVLRSVIAHHLPANEVGQTSVIILAANEMTLEYTVQLAQLEALNEARMMDSDADGKIAPAERKKFLDALAKTLASGLQLEIDGRACTLIPDGDPKLEWPYLKTFRYRVVLDPAQEHGGHVLKFSDRNYTDAPGQKKILVRAESPVQIVKNSLEGSKPKGPEEERILLDPFAGTAIEPEQRQVEVVFVLPAASGGVIP